MEEKKPKQFLMCVDELGMALISQLLPKVMFIEVEGMNIENNPGYQLLANPVKVEEMPEMPIQDQPIG